MKTLVLLLLLPAFAFGQTIHVKDKKIVYEGKVDLGRPVQTVTAAELRLIQGVSSERQASTQVQDSVKVSGKIRLETPHHLVRYVNYCFRLTPLNNGYKYIIDSIYFIEQERGRKTDTLSSEKMLDKMGDTGNIVGEAEKILNETDMRFQKMLAILRSEMKRS